MAAGCSNRDAGSSRQSLDPAANSGGGARPGVLDELVNRRAAGELLWCEPLGRAERAVGLLVLPPLEIGRCHVDEKGGSPLGDRNPVNLDRLGVSEGIARVPQSSRHGDPMEMHIGRAKCRPSQVGVHSKPSSRVLRLAKKLLGARRVSALRGCDRTAKQQRPVNRQDVISGFAQPADSFLPMRLASISASS